MFFDFFKKLFHRSEENEQKEFYPVHPITGELSIKCGAIADKIDKRDFIKEIEDVNPEYVDLLWGSNFRITNQNNTNACTGHAMSAFLSALFYKLKSGNALQFNYYYIYYFGRLLSGGTVEKDDGAYLRATMKAVANYGAIVKEMSSLSSVYSKPSESEIRNASLLKIREYFRLPSNDIYRAMLYTLVKEKLPVLISLYYNKKDWDFAKKTGLLVPMTESGSNNSGHAICVYGFDPSDCSFLATNSWGTMWGNNGYFKISRESLERDLMDAWTVGYNYF
jgi:hypothetical protein